jgi:acetylornithine deacetylase/succinyl-diaminopimelate desuccinylase-like protein
MDVRSAVESGWEHQLELLRALVRSPSLLGSERDAQELVAAERADQVDNAALKALPVIAAIRELEAQVNSEARSPWFAAHPHPLNYNVGVVRAGDWASSVPEEGVLGGAAGGAPGRGSRCREVAARGRRG